MSRSSKNGDYIFQLLNHVEELKWLFSPYLLLISIKPFIFVEKFVKSDEPSVQLRIFIQVLIVSFLSNPFNYKIIEIQNSKFLNLLLDPMSKIIFRCLVHSGLLAAESFLILLSWLSPHEIFMQLIWCVTDKSLVRTSGTSMLKLLLLKKAILGWWLFQYLSMFG